MPKSCKKIYNPQEIEPKWQKFWEDEQFFLQTERNFEANAEKIYLLFAFAYPSGSGLHVGHVESKTALDILARYYRMNGQQVFFPVGWDAFGLPAENYAVKTGVHPAETTKNAINTFRRQIKRLAISYDWANEIATCHPGYYQWTQWLFLQLHQAGLAYQDTGMVNWCPSCQTVLANEQVVNGECERCGSEVGQKEMEQWFFKITQYRDELIAGLDQVNWPEPTKQQQLNWIGKSEGLKEIWQVKDMDLKLTSFTTWPHTTWGATFMVVAPEHPIIEQLTAGTDKEREVKEFCQKIVNQKAGSAIIKTKEGIFTGRYAINPLTGWEMPIWVGNFALMNFGTGIVKACPAHDERDFEFAQKYDLPIKKVIDSGDPNQPECYPGEGVMVNAGDLTGLDTQSAREKITKQAIKKGYGEKMTTYKLRDWLISRQRYWGAPIPIIYDPAGQPHPIKVDHLPWKLPTDVDFKPTGESPLTSSQEFLERTEQYAAEHYADLIKEKSWDQAGKGWRPEFDTMDTFVCSSWYYLRYVDARNEQEFASREQLDKWLPVDFYMIGPEHIVLHLLYSRFLTKFLRDQGYLKFDEPFLKMRHQGMILGPDGKKMSKSKGNVINPDEVIEKFGADTLRIYEMFMGPIEADKPWDVSAVAGIYRFLNKVHQLVMTWIEAVESGEQTGKKVSNDLENESDLTEVRRHLHRTIAKVSTDLPRLKFNTAVAAMMEFINTWMPAVDKSPRAGLKRDEVVAFVKLLAPLAPFLAEDLYQDLVKVSQEKSQSTLQTKSVHLSVWPEWDQELAKDEWVTIAVQINGKVRAQLEVEHDRIQEKEYVLTQAKDIEAVKKWLADKKLIKEIYIPGKIVSLVVR